VERVSCSADQEVVMAAKKTASKKASAARTTPKKSAPAKKSAAEKVAPAKKTATKKVATAKKAAPAKKAAVKKAVPAQKAASAKTTVKEKKATAKKVQPTKGKASSAPTAKEQSSGLPKARFTKDGIGYTKDFDVKFVKAQRDLLLEERQRLLGQAEQLTAEANQLIEEAEMGDVQFDDEGGEGDTMAVERERDLALSAQAREAVTAIDEALERMADGTYGYSVVSGRPIPRERLEAIPWSTELVEEKVGGIGRR
jgi:RNA polymerase-binding transcription factor DksA